MRRSLLFSCLVALALAVPVTFASTRTAGTLSVEGGVGYVTVRGQGTIVGRLDRGEIVLNDASPGDQWSPRLNGVPRGRVVSARGRDMTFFVPGGRYRVSLRGEGISLSARGIGVAQLRARPGARIDAGTYATGDAAPTPLPDELTRVSFGAPDDGQP
jgi:hypothetical protein